MINIQQVTYYVMKLDQNIEQVKKIYFERQQGDVGDDDQFLQQFPDIGRSIRARRIDRRLYFPEIKIRSSNRKKKVKLLKLLDYISQFAFRKHKY